MLTTEESAEQQRRSKATKDANRRKKEGVRNITHFLSRGNNAQAATSETINVDDGNNSNGASSNDDALNNRAEVATNEEETHDDEEQNNNNDEEEEDNNNSSNNNDNDDDQNENEEDEEVVAINNNAARYVNPADATARSDCTSSKAHQGATIPVQSYGNATPLFAIFNR